MDRAPYIAVAPTDRTSVIYTELPDRDGPTQSGATPETPDTASSDDFIEHDQPSSHQPTGSTAALPDRGHFRESDDARHSSQSSKNSSLVAKNCRTSSGRTHRRLRSTQPRARTKSESKPDRRQKQKGTKQTEIHGSAPLHHALTQRATAVTHVRRPNPAAKPPVVRQASLPQAARPHEHR